MRKDTNTNECFVGSIVSDDEIYIKEAGDYCIRKMDPKENGMQIYKKGINILSISNTFNFLFFGKFNT